ncbi:DUF29 domain-containing protein [Spirulina sp. CS-785/01]|uniref:DUF29 domain-containing protein n=1 Tax=Spirulina sp. CS-785/01 TaxID=3021716 RepID=UPI00232FAC36|nr:DUF29 domain-containing protein [Spirulina sp. CS-785/01]MDB9312125.1 DUF29 domain-containing protein [Spirulina sp. CS-785/01]
MLYEEDFHRWVERTVEQLRDRNYDQIDWENLIAEIELLGQREKSTLKIHLRGLLRTLLEYKYFPEHSSPHAKDKLLQHRQKIRETLEDSPSLKDYSEELFEESYQRARRAAALEMDVDLDTFPQESPFTWEQTLNPKFLP